MDLVFLSKGRSELKSCLTGKKEKKYIPGVDMSKVVPKGSVYQNQKTKAIYSGAISSISKLQVNAT